MATNPDAPLSGVFRVVYFLAIGVACLFAVVTAITAFYDPPGGDSGYSDSGNPFFQDVTSGTDSDNNERQEYNRNVSLIFAVSAAGALAVAIFALGARFNPLRAGLLLGGSLLFLTSMGFWADSANEWLGFVSASLILLLLAGGFPSLEEGFPLRRGPTTPPRRLTPEEVTIHRQEETPPGDEPPPPAPVD